MADCCVINVPGPVGSNALTALTATFTMPATLGLPGDTLTATVADSSVLAPGLIIYITGLGHLKVVTVVTSTSVTLQNLKYVAGNAYLDNASAGTTAAAGVLLLPGGIQGSSGVTSLTAAAVMPADLAAVTFSVGNNAGFSIGQIIYIQNTGFFEITGLTGSTQITTLNLRNAATSSYSGVVMPSGKILNVVAGTAIANGSRVVAGGLQGPQGVSPIPAPTPAAAILYTDGTTWLKQPYPLQLNQGGTAGTSAATARAALGAAASGVNADITQLTGLTTALSIAQGGTGAVNAAGARANLGLGTIATQNANAVNITGGTVAGITDLAVADGGTGASTAAGARTNLTAAQSGANTDITSLGGLTTPLSLDQGGTGYTAGFEEAMYRDEKASGTAGGAFNNGAWRTRDLTVESYDPGAIGTLAANQVTLIAGTYIVEGEAPAYMVDNHQCRFQNITAGTTVAFGTTARSAATDDIVTISRIHYRFSIAVNSVFEFQHQCTTTRAADGFGVASTYGNVEVYAWIKFIRVA